MSECTAPKRGHRSGSAEEKLCPVHGIKTKSKGKRQELYKQQYLEMLNTDWDQEFLNHESYMVNEFRKYAQSLKNIGYDCEPNYQELSKELNTPFEKGDVFLIIDPNINNDPYDRFIINIANSFDTSKPLITFTDEDINKYPGKNSTQKYFNLLKNCEQDFNVPKSNLIDINDVKSGKFTNQWDIDDSYYHSLATTPGVRTLVFDEMAPHPYYNQEAKNWKLGPVETITSFETRTGRAFEERMIFP